MSLSNTAFGAGFAGTGMGATSNAAADVDDGDCDGSGDNDDADTNVNAAIADSDSAAKVFKLAAATTCVSCRGGWASACVSESRSSAKAINLMCGSLGSAGLRIS